jgi:carbamoyl-phosphate synthase small subunit
MRKKVYLTLQNGVVFQGYSFGAKGDTMGELVFSTGMVGYIETLTDPSNYGQIVVQTFPLIGNYGVMESDAESDKAHVAAYVVREICDKPSNFRMEGTLDEYLKKQGVVGIYDVDTRELTKILREEGTMNAKISDRPLTKAAKEKLAEYTLTDCVKAVAPDCVQEYGDTNAKYTVAYWNFGAKKSSILRLVEQGCKVISLPATTSASEILSLKIDGLVVGDGPGDPKQLPEMIANLKELLGKIPMLGVGLGHQLIALALGADTQKQKCGHRGSNQPVKYLQNGRVYISTQNHDYVVKANSLQTGKISFVNVNDNTCEGIDYDDINAFSVQFMPESCIAGNTENPVYNKFFAMMGKEN